MKRLRGRDRVGAEYDEYSVWLVPSSLWGYLESGRMMLRGKNDCNVGKCYRKGSVGISG